MKCLLALSAISVLVATGCASSADGAATNTPRQAQETTTAAPAPGTVAPLQIPPLDFKSRTLPNGLTVYSAKDSNTASVTVQVWYKVGSKDDPQQRSGFAHLFEHLMFKATRNLPPETFDRLTEDVGGSNNAFTADDTTAYYEIVPAQHLQRILFAEAERMGSLVVDQAAFASERDVVKEELRQRVLADPYGRLFSTYLTQESFAEHPYRRPGIGNLADLDAATLDEVLRFHATFYRPDNAYLIVAGDFDQAQLDGWIDQYFSPIQKPDRALPANDVKEPPRSAPRSVTYYAPNVPLPAVTINWQLPKYADEDAAALMVLDDVLSVGASSRLYRSLVYEQQISAEASSSIGLQQQAGSITLYSLMTDGHSLAEGEKALLDEVEKLRSQPISAAELDEAKRELIAGTLRAREGVMGRANELGNSLIMAGDPAAADKQLAAIQTTTVADVQRVARKYLDPNLRVTLNYLDESEKPANVPSEPRGPAEGAPVQIANLAPASEPVKLAPEGERVALPGPGAERPVPTPSVSQKSLPNGLRVLVAPTHDVPLVSARLSFDTGTAEDPADKKGVASLTAGLLTEGTTTKSAPEISTEIESLGAIIGASAGFDFSSISANGPADVFPQTAALLAEIVRTPAFAQEELDRAKRQTLDGLRISLTEPSSLASYAVARAVFGGAPYGAVASGTPASIPTITRDDVAAFHRTRWRPSTAKLVFSGDIEPEAAYALAERLFGDWQDPADAADPVEDRAGAPVQPRVIAIDLPGTGQAAVYAAARGIPRTSNEFYPLVVGNVVLGNGYSARLNTEIRLKRGLSYGASSSLATRLDGGLLVASAQTRNDAAAQVVDLLLTEFERITREPIPKAELDVRATALVGSFARGLESVDGLGSQVASFANYGLPLSELKDYTPKVRAVTPAQITEAYRERFPISAYSIVIAGDAKTFLPALRTKHPDVEVIPASELNLDSPTLR
ncbi:MAG: pitrilysin family protein [Polyangiales bacterium]